LINLNSTILQRYKNYTKLTIPNHHCSVGRIGGFFERVKEGILLGHVLEHTAIELQNLAGMDVGFGKTREAKINVFVMLFFVFMMKLQVFMPEKQL